jgi:hypothetical protein
MPYRGHGRPRALTGLEEWVAARFRRHAGNADVVRQELLVEKGIELILRTIEREVAPQRRELEIPIADRGDSRDDRPLWSQKRFRAANRRTAYAVRPSGYPAALRPRRCGDGGCA